MLARRYVMGIDPGFVPATYCVYDMEQDCVSRLGMFIIEKRSMNNMASTVKKFISEHQEAIDLSEHIFVEIQMRAALKCFTVMLQALLGEDKVTLVAPISVKIELGIHLQGKASRDKYKLNKEISTWYVRTYHPDAFACILQQYDEMNRRLVKARHKPKPFSHDYCEALLICLAYWLPIRKQRVFLRSILN